LDEIETIGAEPEVVSLRAELHLHLNGAIPLPVLKELARRRRVDLPQLGRYRDFAHLMEAMRSLRPLLMTADDLELITYELGRELARQQVRYAEVMTTPHALETRGIGYAAQIEALSRARARAIADFGVQMRWIFEIPRRAPDAVQRRYWSDYTTEVAIDGRGHGHENRSGRYRRRARPRPVRHGPQVRRPSPVEVGGNHDDDLIDAICERFLARGMQPYPDTEGALRELGRLGVPVAIVSNCGRDIRRNFAEHGLERHVHGFALSFEHGAVKPELQLFQLACELLDVEPRRALMVGGDPATDGGAALAGITTLILPAVRQGASRGRDLAVRLVTEQPA
jgi:FMN phosphatase YigB (HAD superfamily)